MPLRHAGQSLEEERRGLIENELETPMLGALLLCVFAGLEWGRYLTDYKPHPVLVTFAAAISVVWCACRILRLRPRIRALRQGIDGERVVGQFLERLRAQDYVVFHDVLGPGFNIDHVLIGPAGVFTIETKTWSKPVRGDARIRFDGQQLLVGKQAPDRDPITQACAQSSWLKGLLTESTGKIFETMPVLLFPGWFVEQAPGSLQHIWVLEPKALPAFLENAPQRCAPADAKLAAFHLSRFIRAAEKDLLSRS
jgi:Nuclease-related domain